MRDIFKLLNQKGQSLLEITISLGLILIVVTALTITTVNGIKNSQLSQNQLQATKLAQEGLEKVRQIRELNCPVRLSDSGSWTEYKWYGFDPLLIWDKALGLTGKDFRFNTLNETPSCALSESSADSSLNDPKFIRKINLITDTSARTVKVTSSVSWTDFSGDHKTELTTILSDI